MWLRLVAAFAKMIQSKVGQWFAALMVALGIGMATNTLVMGPAISELKDMMVNTNGGGGQLGTVALNWLGFLKFDIAVTMVISAYAARHSIRTAKVFLTKRG